MSDRFFLPATTSMLVNDHIARCKNLGLILDKYPPQSVVSDTKNKGPWLQDLVKGSHIDTVLVQSAYNRWYSMMSAMKAMLFNASLDWRMVIGLGGESVLETDITLHHLYGIPFIPASALKGLTRAYVTGEVEGYKSDKIDNDNTEVERIFGSQEHAGTVIFFDAMPVNGITNFVLDIMNPHYPEYYAGNKLPTNDQNPVPITFLTVTNTTFTFALTPRDSSKEQHVKDVEQVNAWLQEAIQKYGVGGKTSAGYGYFKKEMSSAEPPQPVKAHEPVIQTQAQSRPAEHIRPKIPQFREGQEITGSVVAQTDELRRIAPPDAQAFLRYQSFATKDVLIVVRTEEAQNWKPGETRICVFVREEVRDGCNVLVCQPRPSKKKK
jgi:CRISPR type III-B/RAMP module RAMP protein Cmr6